MQTYLILVYFTDTAFFKEIHDLCQPCIEQVHGLEFLFPFLPSTPWAQELCETDSFFLSQVFIISK